MDHGTLQAAVTTVCYSVWRHEHANNTSADSEPPLDTLLSRKGHCMLSEHPQLPQCVLRALPSLLLVVDSDGNVSLSSRDTFALAGAEIASPVGRALTDVLPPALVAAAELPAVLERAAAGETVVVENVRVTTAPRCVCYIDVRACPVAADSGGQSGLTLIELSDVTTRVAAANQEKHSLKMTSVGRLAGGVAHDFNNLLMVIMTSAEFAKEDLPGDSAAAEDLADILAAAERASGLTRQLLAFSRRQPLQTFVLNLNLLIDEAQDDLRQRLGDEIELAFEPDPLLAAVTADAEQIEEVLLTLADNAREAIRETGCLTIRTANATLGAGDAYRVLEGSEMVPGEYVELAVTDTGRGMDETVIPHIFEPFFTTKEKGKGPGLGLATVYGIVRQHKGYIAVDSEPDQGTTIQIFLPQAKDAVG